jgi:hypothetical protein
MPVYYSPPLNEYFYKSHKELKEEGKPMNNKIPCGQCRFFDQQYLGNADGSQRAAWYGLCTKRTVYPATERDGRTFPEEAVRASSVETEISEVKAHCVAIKQVISACHLVQKI